MPLFMPTSCQYQSHCHFTVYTQGPQHHDSQAGHQGGLPVQLFWTPQPLQRAKQGQSDHAAKYSVLLKDLQSLMWPLCTAIPSCQSAILVLLADANHSDTLGMGWSMFGAPSVLSGRSTFTWLTQLLATVNIQWTTPGLQKVHFILLYGEQQVHRYYLLFPRTSDTAN